MIHLETSPGVLENEKGPFEIQVRRKSPIRKKFCMDTPQMVSSFWNQVIRRRPWYDEEKEMAVAFSLDARLYLQSWHLVSIGSTNETMMPVREVFRPALCSGAVRLIIAHNHPSGSREPSKQDYKTTQQIHQAGVMLGVPLEDHVIITRNGCRSIRESLEGYPVSPWNNPQKQEEQRSTFEKINAAAKGEPSETMKTIQISVSESDYERYQEISSIALKSWRDEKMNPLGIEEFAKWGIDKLADEYAWTLEKNKPASVISGPWKPR